MEIDQVIHEHKLSFAECTLMWKQELKISFYDVSTLEPDVRTFVWAMRAHIASAQALPTVVALVVLLVSLELLVAAL